ncbi:MAG TPA: PQQ-binding-like beta-propeller repeat protein [Polyangia bacterium]|nr:PQQ-binding-like beta-propeller repeat protein [Polyangia bacterium]
MPQKALLSIVVLGLASACQPARSAPHRLAAAAPVTRPAPGADLDGPPPLPRKPERHARGRTAQPLDLGADRPAVPIAVPVPPRGGAAGFSFGDDRRGWVVRIPESQQLPAVAYGDGRVYVSGGFESVSFYALDAGDGHIVWSQHGLEDNGPTAPVYDNGDVIFNTESCTLFVVDAKTGKKLWFKYLGDPTLAQPAVADGLVFAAHPGQTGPEFSAYKLRSGTEVWTRTVGGELLAAPIIDGDSVYVSTIQGRTFRFLRASGKQMWSQALGATTAPWIVGAELYLSRRAGDREEQVVVSAATGAVLRRHGATPAKYIADVPSSLGNWKQVWAFEGSRPAVVGGVRYVAMGGEVEASDPRTGERLWVRRAAHAGNSRALGTVAVAGSQIVIATRSGQIFGLDVDTGYTLWAYDLGHAIAAEPIVARGWVYASTTDGQVIALNVADSSLDGWHMFGGNPRHNGPVTGPRI